jgi:hypothetical protein
MVKLSSVTSSSSSDDDTTSPPQLCMKDRDADGICVVYSHHWTSELTPRYSQGSFAIYNHKMTVIIEMNPMFVWRLIGTIKSSPERVVDNDRIRTRASFDMKTNPIVCIVPHTNPCFLSLLDAFNVLFADRYNTPEKVQKMLLSLSEVVQYKYT